MPRLEATWYRRLVFFSVYLVQSIITVTTLSLFPLLFSDLGVSPVTYGVVGSLSLLPMAFKVFLGPLSDWIPIPLFRGRRRGYIIVGALLNVLCLPWLALNPLMFTVLFGIVWFCQTLGIAIVDLMVDALAIGGTPALQHPRGRTSASLWMFFGIFVGGGVASGFAAVLDGYALNPANAIDPALLGLLGITSIFAVIPLILIWVLKEPSAPQPSPWTLQRVKANLRYPFVRWGLLFAFLLNIDRGLLELTLEPFIKTHLGVSSLGEIVSQLFFISLLGVILAALGYKFIDRVQKHKLLMVINLIYVVPSITIAWLILDGRLTYGMFLGLYASFALISGLSYVTYMALFFELSDPKAAGTMIALFLGVSNLGTVVGVACGGFLSMGVIYLLVAVLCAGRTLPLARLRVQEVTKVYYGEGPNDLDS